MASREEHLSVLAALASHGSDLTKPAHIVHYLYFKSLDAAEAAAKALHEDGYQQTRVHPAPGTSLLKRLLGRREYSCIAETHAVPSESYVLTTVHRMDALASRLGGEYDGWEASIEK